MSNLVLLFSGRYRALTGIRVVPLLPYGLRCFGTGSPLTKHLAKCLSFVIADQEGGFARHRRRDRELGDHPAQQSGHGRVHVEARQLRHVLRATQAGDSPEDWVHWTDHPDKDATESQIHQFGESSPTGAG